MKLYSELKRTWRHNDANYIPRLKEVFPELKSISSEDLADRFIDMGMDFYMETEPKKISIFRRLSLPLALIMYFVMFLGMPLNYIINGSWGYNFNKSGKIYNWFRSLGLI